jgi:Fur family transcriptional regulator, ferric uptake regulator
VGVSYVTQQKQVVGRVFERAKRPLTPAEICAEARRRVPSLGIATVYRTIKQLVAEGQVRAVELPGIAPHYESATRHHHHFFLCQQCERLFDLVGCLQDVQSLAPSGFRVQEHEIVLYGECATCVGKPSRVRRSVA